MTDLRTLAQAVVDAWELPAHMHKVYDALAALGAALGDVDDLSVDAARAILAALDAADAQGYARAMGEVVERCEQEADYTGWSDYAAGHKDAHERLAVWARERLPAADERD